MNGEPTIVIHNYAGGSEGPVDAIAMGEVSRFTSGADYNGWMWSPAGTEDSPTVDFKNGRTYVIYELPNG